MAASRRRGYFSALVLVATAAIAIMATAAAWAEERESVLGSGIITGLYFPLAGKICELVNGSPDKQAPQCKVEATEGSVQNISGVRNGEYDLAIVQSDVQYHAYNGTRVFSNQRPFRTLRSVMKLHEELFTVVARADTGIKRFQDLRGKRVNIGPKGSGQRATFTSLIESMGWALSEFAATTELDALEQTRALCLNKVDAIVFFVAHPNGNVRDATEYCASRFVEVSGPQVDRFIRSAPYFGRAALAGNVYKGNPADVPTISVRATLVATTSVAPATIARVVRALDRDLAKLRGVHPALSGLRASDIFSGDFSAPLHDGVRQYLKEKK